MKRVVLSFWLLNCLAISMTIVTLAGLVGWLRARRWGPPLALVGAGMFGYSAINSMGWAIHNQPALAIPMGLSLLGLPLLFAAVRRSV